MILNIQMRNTPREIKHITEEGMLKKENVEKGKIKISKQ